MIKVRVVVITPSPLCLASSLFRRSKAEKMSKGEMVKDLSSCKDKP